MHFFQFLFLFLFLFGGAFSSAQGDADDSACTEYIEVCTTTVTLYGPRPTDAAGDLCEAADCRRTLPHLTDRDLGTDEQRARIEQYFKWLESKSSSISPELDEFLRQIDNIFTNMKVKPTAGAIRFLVYTACDNPEPKCEIDDATIEGVVRIVQDLEKDPMTAKDIAKFMECVLRESEIRETNQAAAPTLDTNQQPLTGRF